MTGRETDGVSGDHSVGPCPARVQACVPRFCPGLNYGRMKELHVVGAAILRGSECLVARRGSSMSLPGKWEFPGGKVEAGEDPRAALVREIREELGLHISVADCVGRGTAIMGDRRIVLDVYLATMTGGDLALAEHAEVAWCGADTLQALDWAEADVPVLAAVKARLEGRSAPPRLDIIGDIHGQDETLEALLTDLGYHQGRHPEGRRLVFLGDLVDRGQKSFEVADRVRQLCETGEHLCLMGNHEFNLVEWRRDRMKPKKSNEATIGEIKQRRERWTPVLDFFETLPVALELQDLRVTHAVWHEAAFQAIAPVLSSPPKSAPVRAEPWGSLIRLHSPYEDGHLRARLPRDKLPGQGEPALEVFLKGYEIPARPPFIDNDEVERDKERARWWQGTPPEVLRDKRVIFGHYWNLPPVSGRHEAFAPPHPSGHPELRAWAEAHHEHVEESGSLAVPSNVHAVCVDYNGVTNIEVRACVGAYRYPEAEVVWRARPIQR